MQISILFLIFDADPDPTFHPDADPGPTFHPDSDPDPDPDSNFKKGANPGKRATVHIPFGLTSAN